MGERPSELESFGPDEEFWYGGDDDSTLSSWLDSWSSQELSHSSAWQRIECYRERKWLLEQLDDYGFSDAALEDEI